MKYKDFKTMNAVEMKGVKGGYANEGGGNYQTELECTTPNGTEKWKRACTSAGATADCKTIYPAYGENVSGECYILVNT